MLVGEPSFSTARDLFVSDLIVVDGMSLDDACWYTLLSSPILGVLLMYKC